MVIITTGPLGFRTWVVLELPQIDVLNVFNALSNNSIPAPFPTVPDKSLGNAGGFYSCTLPALLLLYYSIIMYTI